MLQNVAQPRTFEPSKATNRRVLGAYEPRCFSEHSWYRFLQDRREILVRRVGGSPTERQSFLIGELIAAQWDRRRLQAHAEAERERAKIDDESGKVAAEFERLANEAGRRIILLDRALAETERTAKPTPAPKSPTIADIIARATDGG
jgi:hypothetical protein